MVSPSPAPIVICAGQYGSASTWLYNVLHALLARRLGAERIHRQFADSTEALPDRADPDRLLLLKTHRPTRGLRWLALRGGGRVVLSVRDPRDAAASLMSRFHFDYAHVSSQVAGASAALPLLAAELPCLVLRYEDRFMDDPATIAHLAGFIGVPAEPGFVAELFASLRPEAVRAEIARLTEAGVFGTGLTGEKYDPSTHWHPGHVGDGLPGKFGHVLTENQAGDIIRLTRGFQRAFGYPMPPPPPPPPDMRLAIEGWGPGLAYLGRGFTVADERGVWTEGPEAWLHLPPCKAQRLDLHVELPRPRPKQALPLPANPMRWSIWMRDGTAPLFGPVEAAATPKRQVVSVPLPGTPADFVLRFEDLAQAHATGLERSKRLLGLRLRAISLRSSPRNTRAGENRGPVPHG